MSEPRNFQSMIMTLQRFWAEQNCIIWQPYYTQVGAGTMNPATYLRVLGPEPWRVGYVEPSIRPDDGRYGENPNRMQMHYQFQVILKPDPGNPQEIYIKSLEALGINPREHDIRFVEDNWEQPAIGAWGLGWEVWLDGQEITQFTYFQQAGGHILDPVSVELTYGLERIAIALQRVKGFTEIQWSPYFTDGDVNLQAEQEHSKYYFEIADVERLRKMYELFEAEAKACLEKDLVLPAHDYVLKCSHTFNVLDTRGAVGVTERQAMFGRMRDLARQVTTAYLDQRQRMEYPWLDRPVGGPMDARPAAPLSPADYPAPSAPADFVFEVGTEELPVGDLNGALAQLRAAVPGLLDDLRLEHGEVRVLGTPRRLVVFVQDLASRQADLEQLVKGPPADRAFDRFGEPTRAAEGFARSKGVAVEDLQVREMDGGRYVVAPVHETGRPAGEVLSQALPELISALRFDKTMRWNNTNISFSRPIRWLLALFGEQPLDFEFAGVRSGNATRGLRMREPETLIVRDPGDYFAQLETQGIILDVRERRNVIHAQVEVLATEVEGDAEMEPALLNEITNLVEAPHALRGSFDPAHLELPREVLVSVMKKHQRYVPVVAEGPGEERPLLPYFIAVRNGDDQGMELVVEGNEHVIRARFADAAFFVREDLQQPLEAYLPKLDRLTFQARLGSMLDKTGRIERLVEELGVQMDLTTEELDYTRRAAHLAKADLATQMVVEMTSLQGVMGRRYAEASGESEAVAVAIFEHYLPRYAGDLTPASRPGLVVGLADRLDSLVGLFAADLIPTGNKDPFALRRAALGLVQNLITWNFDLDLRSAVDAAAAVQPISVSEETRSAVLDFIAERLRYTLLEENFRYDVVDAVVTAQGHNPARAHRAAQSLSGWVARPDWDRILPAYSRCVRITRDLEERYAVNPEKFEEPAERELYTAYKTAEGALMQDAETGTTAVRAPIAGSVDEFLNVFLPMIPAINRFFDDVLVMAENVELRRNRLGLLQDIVALSNGVADFSRLEGF